MKPRIKQFWDQAAKEHGGDTWVDHIAFMEKFADLIIEETHQVIVVGGVDDLDGVKKHFEIE